MRDLKLYKRPLLLNYRGTEYLLPGLPLTCLHEREFTGQIFAADTESANVDGRAIPLCLTLAWRSEGNALRSEYVQAYPAGHPPLLISLFDWCFATYPAVRDARKSKWSELYGFFHNLAFDWAILIKGGPEVLYFVSRLSALPGQQLQFQIGDYDVTITGLAIFSNVAFVDMSIWRRHVGGLHLKLRDTASYFRAPLEKLAEEEGLPKLEKPRGIGTLEVLKDSHFREYARRDAEATLLVAERILRMVRHAKLGMVPYSAANYAQKLMRRHIDPEQIYVTVPLVAGAGKEGSCDGIQMALNCYLGGRFGYNRTGRFDRVWIYDINSSYPAALSVLPMFEPAGASAIIKFDKCGHKWRDKLVEQLIENPCCFACVDGRADDRLWPILVGKSRQERICGVYGEFSGLYTTGAELLLALQNGVEICWIHWLLPFAGDYKFWSSLIRHYYNLKQSYPKDSTEYRTAKVVLNSLYGKLIQRNDACFVNAKDILVRIPRRAGRERLAEIGLEYYKLWIELLSANMDPNICRQRFREKSRELVPRNYQIVSLSMVPIVQAAFAGYACIPLAAAVTGIARARLAFLMRQAEAFYWDTDGVFSFVGPEELGRRLIDNQPEWPRGLGPLVLGKGLGEVSVEGPFNDVRVAGIKRYVAGDRLAYHGMPNISREQVKSAIDALLDQRRYEYKGRERPIGFRESKDEAEVGFFQSTGPITVVSVDDFCVESSGDFWLARPWSELCEQPQKTSPLILDWS
ncbi:MAG TPA: hypothetical protein EYP19_00045 [Desulfobacterales bacterium]|nr:hypothetical protein [Desulfobacterales bacterium]